jgi:hypothetical protein
MHSRNSLTKAAVIVLIILGNLAIATAQLAPFACPRYHIVKIPNFTAAGGPGQTIGGYPEVHEWNVVWTGNSTVLPIHPEIYLFNGTATTQLTSTPNPGGNWTPHISPAGRIAYTGDTGSTNEIFTYDIATGGIAKLTTATGRWPMVVRDFHDPYIAAEVMDQWLGGPWLPTFIDIDLWDGAKIVTLKSRFFNHSPQLSQYHAVYQSAWTPSGPYDIFLYNAGTTTQMTNRPGWTWTSPQLDAPYLVWSGYSATDSQIVLSDLNQGTTFRHTVASATTPKQPKLKVAQNHVIWSWADDIAPGDSVWHYEHKPFTIPTKIFPTQPSHLLGATCDSIAVSYPWAAFAVSLPGHCEIYLYDLVNHGLPQLIAVQPVMSPHPVYVRLSTKFYPPYTPIPVIVWETDFGGIANQAFMATRPICPNPLSADFPPNDCEVDAADMAYMAARWGMSNTPADLDNSGTVDLPDLWILAQQWQQCNTKPDIYKRMW